MAVAFHDSVWSSSERGASLIVSVVYKGFLELAVSFLK